MSQQARMREDGHHLDEADSNRSAKEGMRIGKLIEHLPFGLALMGSDSTVIAANRFAAATLPFNRVTNKRAPFTNLLCAKQAKAWSKAISNACDGLSSLLQIYIEDRPLTIALSTGPEIEEGHFSVWLLVERRNEIGETESRYLSIAYGLTESEIAILRYLAKGTAPKRIAIIRAVSIHTVRTQVRSILEKTQAANVVDLLLRLARLPPIATVDHLELSAPVRTNIRLNR